MFLVVRLRCVLRCGICAIVFDSRYFLIRALVSILVGVISFVLVLLNTLGVGIFGIVFSMAAAWIGSVCVRCGCSFALGVTVVSLGSVSIGALAVHRKFPSIVSDLYPSVLELFQVCC